MHSDAPAPPFYSGEVADVFAAWPLPVGEKLLDLRRMIFSVAQATNGVGRVEETLRWGVPAYLTTKPKSGTTLRLESKGDTGTYGLYVPCSTSLIQNCRERYGETFRFEKNRGLIFSADRPVAEPELRHFIAMALTYHLKCVPNDASRGADPRVQTRESTPQGPAPEMNCSDTENFCRPKRLRSPT